jgi:hypothetical protein
MANNGQTMAGLNASSVFYNVTTAIAMLAGRYGLAALALALAGLDSRCKPRHPLWQSTNGPPAAVCLDTRMSKHPIRQAHVLSVRAIYELFT